MAQTTINGGGPGGSFVDGISLVDEVVMEALRANIPDAESRLTALELLAPTGAYPIRRKVTDFPNSTVLALPTTPGVIIPAPGAGKWLDVHRIIVEFKLVGASSYTNIDADAYVSIHTADWTVDHWEYLVQGNTTGRTEVTDFFQVLGYHRWVVKPFLRDANTKFTAGWGMDAHADDLNASADQPLLFTFENNGAGDLTGGDASDIVRVTAFYTEMSVLA